MLKICTHPVIRGTIDLRIQNVIDPSNIIPVMVAGKTSNHLAMSSGSIGAFQNLTHLGSVLNTSLYFALQTLMYKHNDREIR